MSYILNWIQNNIFKTLQKRITEMKKFFLMTVAAFLSFGAVITARTPDSATETVSVTCRQNGKRDCQKSVNGNKCDGQRMGRKDGRHRPDLFKGIELTADQRKALESMRAEQRAERQKARQECQARMNESIRGILTPEQYAQYEKNMTDAKARREVVSGNRDNGESKNRRDMRRGDRKGKVPRDFKSKAAPAVAQPAD